ncbi:MAG: glycosyltransferase family 39 protein [Patescibacteria group bacterium]|nr:glycosyltransferase family 39 protein [Patescibacteria group bacterium]
MIKKQKIIKIIKKIWPWYLLLPLVIVFFVGTSSLNYFTQDYSKSLEQADYVKWASPDETANYIFAKLYAQTGKLSIFESYNLYTDDIMRPRSLRSDHGEIKPVSFLGIILFFGTIAKFTTYKIIPYLTPFFASLGLIFYYLLVKKVFTRTNALISTFILASFPVYIYYTARSMFHNVLFTLALIVALYFAVLCLSQKRKHKIKILKIFTYFKNSLKKNKFVSLQGDYKQMIFALIAGLFFGLAIIARTSELIWLLPLLGFLALLNLRRLGLKKIILILSGIILVLLPMFYYNQILYNSIFLGGYADMNRSIVAIKDSSASLLTEAVQGQFSASKEYIKNIFDSIFVFGFHPRQSLLMADIYIRQMFSVLSYLSLAGFLVYFFGNGKKRVRHYWLFFGLSLVLAILIIYYGSWHFFDNPDKTAHTIGNSYTRYWLPIYLGLIPFASYFIIRVTRALSVIKIRDKNKEEVGQLRLFSRKKYFRASTARFIMRFLSVGLIIISSLNFVYQGSEEGLVFLAAKQRQDKYEWEKVIEITENNSVIITRYHDKLFFPERKVIVGLFDDKNMIERYTRLVDYLPVYYYNFHFPKKDIDYLNLRRLKEFGLSIKLIEHVTPTFALYQLLKIE